ncbi:MAG: GH3 auxin-responsive promoter family protein [Planctomycetota bacterium]
MKLIPWIIRGVVNRRWRQVERARANPAATQREELLRMVRRAAGTEWGRSHGYGGIREVADYQAAVPIQTYEDLAPHWHRSFDGDRDVTWPGLIPYFSLTSGTTLGASKAMPVTKEAILGNRRSGLTLMANLARLDPHADFLDGQILYFGGCTNLAKKGACWQGDASGINAKEMPRMAQKYRLPDFDIAGMTDWEQKVPAICERHWQNRVKSVVGLPSWTLVFFHELVKHVGSVTGKTISTVAEVWPDLGAFVHFGMDFAPYRTQFEEIVGKDILYVDTYSSSEGGLNAIQDQRDDPAMALELDCGVFFEFIPLEEREDADPTRLSLDQVELDVPYSVLLTTVSGIWAYEVGDAVRFTSLNPPRVVFASRTDHQLNVFGEHVIEEHLERAMAAACAASGAEIGNYCVASILPTGGEPRGRHEWLVEFKREPGDPDVFRESLDTELAKASEDYRAHRAKDYQLLPPKITKLREGTFYTWLKETGKVGGQRKVPRVVRTPEMEARIRELG